MTKPEKPMILLASALAGVMLGGCSPDPDPSQYDAGVMGANTEIGAIQLRSVHIDGPPGPAYPAGTDARLWLTLRNTGHDPDTLTAVSSPVAKQAEIRWDDNCDGQFDTVEQLRLQPAVAAASPRPSAVPAFDAYHVHLDNLTREVLAGTTVPVTFRFQHAGTITVEVMVEPSVPRAEPSTRCASSAS